MMKFPYRYIARIIVEAKTPLAIGSDDVKEDQDSPVTKDFNGLPYIPGTAIAGWLRTKLVNLDNLFGEKPNSNRDQPEGSNIITSDAYLLDNEYQVHQQVEILEGEFFDKYRNLPIRQHVAITHLGAAKDNALFDREVVYKGSRFKFEIALELKEKDDNAWNKILNAFYTDDFYIGGGQFDGFGELKVVDEIKVAQFDLSTQLNDYLNITVDLNKNNENFKSYSPEQEQPKHYNETTYTLTGESSFHHFGAGYGDAFVDQINYKEEVIEWDDKTPNFVEKYVIPATSIKGVLAHRVAYYYNIENGNFVEDLIPEIKVQTENQLIQEYDTSHVQPADKLKALQKQKTELEKILEELEKETFKPENLFNDVVGENNPGVVEVFGNAKDSKKQTGQRGQTGKVIIKDIYLDGNLKEHIFYHNKIDRFTGGTVDGALYSEKVLHIPEAKLCIKVKKGTPTGNLNKALDELIQGRLPVGGLVNKGHGIFNLKAKDNDENSNN